MTNHAFTITVDDAISEALIAEATANDTTPERLAGEWLREQADWRRKFDEHYVREIEAAVRQADDPATVWISNEEVKAEFAQRRRELLARAEALGL